MVNSKNKLPIILEVLLVFLGSIGVMWLTNSMESFREWQIQNLGRPVISVLLSTFLVPMAAITFIGLESRPPVLFKWTNLSNAFRSAGRAMTVMIPVTMFSFPVIQFMGYSFISRTGGLIIAGCHLVAIPLLLLLFRKKPIVQEKAFTIKDCLWILIIPVLSLPIIWGVNTLYPKAAGMLTSLVFVGMAEEFKYRGYIQHRLNMFYGKPFAVLGLRFGWGLILTSLMFGLAHVITPGDPLHWAWGLWTAVAGFCFGIIREKGGSFLSSALVHGFIMMFPVIFS